jgi:hypothetical protein
MRSLLIYPTHANCDETLVRLLLERLDAASYPARNTEEDTEDIVNCWNGDADTAEKMGFPVVRTVCPTCPERSRCQEAGYLAALIRVQQAMIALATHKRAEFSTLSELMKGRVFVSIHEDPTSLLRPECRITQADLRQVAWVVMRLLTDPYHLDWFGATEQVDDEGRKYEDAEQKIRRDRQYDFCQHLLTVIESLLTAVDRAEKTREWSPPAAHDRPQGIERLLFWVTRRLNASFEGQPWRFILAAAAGDLRTQAIFVTTFRKKGAKGQVTLTIVKSVVGYRQNPPAAGSTTWFNDATVRPEVLERLVGRPIRNSTPTGHVLLQRKAIQIVRDVSRKTKPQVLRSLIRGVLADRPQFQRVGLILHRPHLAAIEGFESDIVSRIVKSTYFGSGEDRSSNAWHIQCDLILVVGTPRVPEQAVAEYLVQIGEIGAACDESQWGEVIWEGRTESGEVTRVRGKGYRHPHWRLAHRDLVRAALVQAVGRGRGILEQGCEVIVLSTEECGLLLSDAPPEPLNSASQRLLDHLTSATAENVYKEYQTFSAVSTATLAEAVSLSNRQTRDLLRALERRGLVVRAGERKGWRAVAALSSPALEPLPLPSTEGTPC